MAFSLRPLFSAAAFAFACVAAPIAHGGLLLTLEQLVMISEEAAAQAARDSSAGRVLDIEFDEDEAPAVYRVKMLSEKGVVRIVVIDAETGQSVDRP